MRPGAGRRPADARALTRGATLAGKGRKPPEPKTPRQKSAGRTQPASASAAAIPRRGWSWGLVLATAIVLAAAAIALAVDLLTEGSLTARLVSERSKPV